MTPSVLAILTTLEHCDRWSTASEIAREAGRAASTCRRVLRTWSQPGNGAPCGAAGGIPVRADTRGRAVRYLLADEARGWLEDQQTLHAARALLRDRPDTAPKSRLRKLTCGCSRILRASLTTAEEGGILCGMCHTAFRLADDTNLIPAEAVTESDLLPF